MRIEDDGGAFGGLSSANRFALKGHALIIVQLTRLIDNSLVFTRHCFGSLSPFWKKINCLGENF
jgi:hypothetical protein